MALRLIITVAAYIAVGTVYILIVLTRFVWLSVWIPPENTLREKNKINLG
jgi:hypothetical protein